MSAKVLGRVVASQDRPRGPDTRMTVAIPRSWMVEHATIEVDLPRNLACAVCGGGGCDACDRAGAVSLRLRTDPKESVEVTLPKTGAGEAEVAHAITVRIPERGGMPKAGSELPRGNLLLTIQEGEEPSVGVVRLPGPSTPPPPFAAELVGVDGESAGSDRVVWLFVVAILAALAAWFLRK